MPNLKKLLSGFRWQFPGSADSSYYQIINKIQNDPRLSQKRKDELSEDVSYLVGHILSDCDSRVRQNYEGVYSCGIRWMRFSIYDSPSKLVRWLCGDELKAVAMQSHLDSLSDISHLTGKMKEAADRLAA